MANSSYKVTRAVPYAIVSGSIASAAIAGVHVATKDSTVAAGHTSQAQNQQFELATGKKGYVLERNVVAARSLESQIFADDSILSPVLVGAQVEAREIQEGEFEGEDFLLLTGTGAISATTPIGTELTTSGGKLAVALKANGLDKAADGRNGAGAITLTGAEVGAVVRAVIPASDLELPFTGRNGAGAITLAGTLVGDRVRKVVHEDGTDASASFESTITVAGQLQQSSASDLSAQKYIVFIDGVNDASALFESAITVADQIQQSSAANLTGRSFLFLVGSYERPCYRLVSRLAPEDAVNNTFRILVEAL